MSRIISEVRVACRSLRRTDSTWWLAVLTIAVGVGAAAGGTALVRNLLLVPLPVDDPDRLVAAWPLNAQSADGRGAVSLDDLAAIREGARGVAGVAPVHQVGVSQSAAQLGTRQLSLGISLVGASFFEVLGVIPQKGRLLLQDDDRSRDGPVMVISDRFWQQELLADPGVVGRTIQVLGTSFTVVGIAPPRFEFPHGTDAWAPMLAARPEMRDEPDAPWATLVARLRPGVSPSEAGAEFDRVLLTNGPGSERNGGKFVVTSFRSHVIGEYGSTVVLLAIAGLLVLLVAAVNVSGILLSRTLSRLHGLTVRVALGATRARLVRELVAEHALIGLAGGAIGFFLALVLLFVVRREAPAMVAQSLPSSVDPVLLGIVLLATGLVLPIFALWPALFATRSEIESGLRVESRSSVGGRGRAPREILVGVQLGLAVMVVATAVLLLRSLDQLRHRELGFEPDRLVFVGIEPLGGAIDSREAFRSALLDLRGTLRADARVYGVTSATGLPASNGGLQARYWREGADEERPDEVRNIADAELADPGHFRTLGLPLLRGREITAGDQPGSPPVVVVSQSFAQRAWPEDDPLGKRLRLHTGPGWRTVVGVVADARYRDFLESRPTLYLPAAQMEGFSAGYVVVRPLQDPTGSLGWLRDLVRAADPRLGIRVLQTGDQILGVPLARPRFLAVALSGLALAATLLAIAGLVGMMLIGIQTRQSEFAIRMAVGASPSRIRTLVLKRSIRIAAIGLALGLGAATISARLLRGMLYGVTPGDPATYLVASSALLTATLLTAFLVSGRAGLEGWGDPDPGRLIGLNRARERRAIS